MLVKMSFSELFSLIDCRLQREVQDRPFGLEVVASFWVTCFRWRMLWAGSHYSLLACKPPVQGATASQIHSAMLHASETWSLTKPNLQPLQHNNKATFRQICDIKPEKEATVSFMRFYSRANSYGHVATVSSLTTLSPLFYGKSASKSWIQE